MHQPPHQTGASQHPGSTNEWNPYDGGVATNAMQDLSDISAEKLQWWRQHGNSLPPPSKKVGQIAHLVLSSILALVIGGGGVGALVAALNAPKAVGVAILATIGLILLFFAYLMVWSSVRALNAGRAKSPTMALQGFYTYVATGKHDNAAAMVLPCDFDNSERYLPQVKGLGAVGPNPLMFGNPGAFKLYWDTLLRQGIAPYCLVKVANAKEHHLLPGVCVVSFTLKTQCNTRMWWLLIPLGILIAIIVDMASRRRASVPLQKVLVQCGGHWQLFNAELQGQEELDTSWVV